MTLDNHHSIDFKINDYDLFPTSKERPTIHLWLFFIYFSSSPAFHTTFIINFYQGTFSVAKVGEDPFPVTLCHVGGVLTSGIKTSRKPRSGVSS